MHMKPLSTLVLTLAAVALAPTVKRSAMVQAQQPAAATSATPLVFDEVTVVDVELGHLIPTQRVVIVGNRIQAVEVWLRYGCHRERGS